VVLNAVLMNTTVLWYVMPCSLEARYNMQGKPDSSFLRINSKPSEDSSSPAISITAPLLAYTLNISISLVSFSMLSSSGLNIAINVSKGTVALLVKIRRRMQGPRQNSSLGSQ
jgi:hypothetical protein